MAAPNGNKNAEKWTEETVLQKIEEMQNYFLSSRDYTLNGALFNVDLYADWWGDMTDKFKENKIVYRAIKNTEKILETKIVNDTMVGDAKSAAFSIFLLKNKFGYVDKHEQDLTTKGESLNVINLGDGIKPNETTT